MIIGILSGFHILLCVALVVIIYFARPDTSGLSALANSFSGSGGGKTVRRFRPITKVIFVLVLIFFGNSVFLDKLMDKESRKSSIINKIENISEKTSD